MRRIINPQPAKQLALVFGGGGASGAAQKRRRIVLVEEMRAIAGENSTADDSFVWALVGLTKWQSKEEPPCSGYWDVKQKSGREESATRWWYGPNLAGVWEWRDQPPVRANENGAFGRNIPHAVLMQSHEWRGLAAAPKEGYSYAINRPWRVPIPDGVRELRVTVGGAGLVGLPDNATPIAGAGSKRRMVQA